MSRIAILGAGMAGYGAAHRLAHSGHHVRIFDRNAYRGGHAASFRHPGGWIFDDGPHISFTKNERIQRLFAESVGQRFERLQAHANNHWKGHWLKHPAQCNLHGLPVDLLVRIIADFVESSRAQPGPIRNYADWLVASYGRTFAETFPMQYGRKFHTTSAENMTTDWLGPRLYRPSLEEVLRGALSPQTPDVHYIDHFRYPIHGGFGSYINGFVDLAETFLEHELIEIDPSNQTLHFANGAVENYDAVVSSLPLPSLIKLIPSAPADVVDAAAKLAWTRVVLVNLGIARSDISSAHWSYFYDEDIVFSRLSFPHMLSPHTVPPGCGSIQAEIYFSDKFQPLQQPPDTLIPRTIADLRRCGLLREDDKILFSEAILSPFAQVIFDLDRPKALETVRGYLRDIGVEVCGRYGEWGYLWTDESFVSGEHAGERALQRVSTAPSLA